MLSGDPGAHARAVLMPRPPVHPKDVTRRRGIGCWQNIIEVSPHLDGVLEHILGDEVLGLLRYARATAPSVRAGWHHST
ncbi:hypothetical protein Kpho01_12480 [Kitasatospora phosalacinea]|uniref:Uncharacterized protein n=2 Tax=Kitasatospora phosalacinea TaxID=2065 RepID=A0A9W6PE38_9ACTN|nr:hypothetical protein Kpho01_12480 [Kitasatospora phosalacinea]